MTPGEGAQRVEQRSTGLTRVFLEMLLLHHIEHREPDGARHGAPPERAEELHPVVERRGDLWRRHHGAQRIAVADRFPQDHDVGDDALGFEGVETGAHPAVGRLHLVGDAHAPGRADDRIDMGEVAVRQDDLAADARSAFGDEGGRIPDLPRDLRVFLPRARIVAPELAAVGVGNRHDVHPRPGALSARAVELVRADVDERGRVSVIRAVHDNHVAPARVCARQAQRQLVRLAAGAHEIADAERIRQRRDEALREPRQAVVQIPGVGVEQQHLFDAGPHDARMAVPDVRHVVVRVEIAPSRMVVEVLHPAADGLDGLSICHRQVGADDPPARRERIFRRLSARLPQRRFHRRRIERGQRGQGVAYRTLADRQVGVVRALFLLSRRDRDARAQPQQHEAEDRSDLVVVQGTDRLVAAHDRDGCRQRIGLAQHGVGDRDREIRDRIGVDDVAEVENSRHPPPKGGSHGSKWGNLVASAFRRKIRDEDVVVVGIVVHRGPAQSGEPGGVAPLDPIGELRDERAHRRVLHLRRPFAHERQPLRQVPVELAVDRRMVEAVERGVQLGDGSPDVLEEIGGRLGLREGHARQPRQHAHVVARPGRRDDGGDPRPVARRHDARTAVGPAGNARKRLVLRLEQRAVLCRIRDLQHRAIAAGGLEQEILVALARERGRLRHQAVQPPCQLGGLRRGQRGRELQDVHRHDYPRYTVQARPRRSPRPQRPRGSFVIVVFFVIFVIEPSAVTC